ncbi:hypothetical protein Hypma_008957 [Hypsizygus marmoreus]|uniref:Aminoglycoside phosphotransferase domain-containing protein n=1 Tax=Hypsizygus marmoreus TaxID=39966 RepID=A0A369JXM6_HYPMA|nr:hypothetical protein Hypma_008957 [Hypsizygus marmoreus]
MATGTPAPSEFSCSEVSKFVALQRACINWRIRIGIKRFGPWGIGIYRIGQNSMAKLVPNPAEVLNMKYIAEHTTIPVPHVQDHFSRKGRCYLIMDYIHAPSLDFVWHRFSRLEKSCLLAQLHQFLTQLRNLTPPHPGYVEAAGGLPCYDVRLDRKPFGPFTSVQDFHEWLGHGYMRTADEHREYRPIFEACAKRSYKTVFTHGDIAPRNILVKGAKIVGLIDWDTSGWYPEYWEYARLHNAGSSLLPEDFAHGLLELMTPYPTETEAERILSAVSESRC